MTNYDCVVEQQEVGEYTVKVLLDMDPREPFDCDMPPTWGIDLSNHRDYRSPTYGEPMPISMGVAMDPEPEDKWDRMQFFKNYYVLPVYLYDHGGRTVYTSGFDCPWDSGMAGFVYIQKRAFWKEWGLKKSMKAAEKAVAAEEFLRGTVEELDYHMTGQVYGYVVEDEYGEEADSCWGFVGESDYCMEEGVFAAQGCARYYRKRRLSFIRDMVRNRVPLEKRQHLLEMGAAHAAQRY